MAKKRENFKEKIEESLDFLKKIGHSRNDIEKKLGLAINAINQSLSRDASKRLYFEIELYKEWAVLSNSMTGKPVTPVIENDGRGTDLILHARNQAVQEVLIEYLASLKKTSFQEVYAAVRTKESEIVKRLKEGGNLF